MATIVILEHLLQRELRLPYLVYALAEHWRAAGHRVLVHHGIEGAPAGDLAIMNVDLTRIPDAYRALAVRYPCVVNGNVHDVSKSRFSKDLVTRGDNWTGPVIVKTDCNYFGRPENFMRGVAARAGLSTDIPETPQADEYRVYRTPAEVPQAAWLAPGVVVEKFLPEQDALGYYLRVWLFFGDRETSGRWRARVPIIKGEDLLEREEVPVPEEIRQRRRELGFDYGKFDYVRHGDRFVLLDANRTPSLTPAVGGRSAALPGILAGGLNGYLR